MVLPPSRLTPRWDDHYCFLRLPVWPTKKCLVFQGRAWWQGFPPVCLTTWLSKRNGGKFRELIQDFPKLDDWAAHWHVILPGRTGGRNFQTGNISFPQPCIAWVIWHTVNIDIVTIRYFDFLLSVTVFVCDPWLKMSCLTIHLSDIVIVSICSGPTMCTISNFYCILSHKFSIGYASVSTERLQTPVSMQEIKELCL